MKKYIALLLSVACIITCAIAFVACGKKEPVEDPTALETANTVYNVEGNAGSITIDENVAATLLGAYPEEALGLEKSIDEYELKLSATRVFNQDACMVEAFADGSETAEGVFAVIGQNCYVYSKEKDSYLLLTATGAVEVTKADTSETNENESAEATEEQPSFEYDKDNNDKLQQNFSAYDKSELGIEKDLNEYIMVVTGTTTGAEDGKKVYIIRLYEATGKATNFTLAFNEGGNYAFDNESGKYKQLG